VGTGGGHGESFSPLSFLFLLDSFSKWLLGEVGIHGGGWMPWKGVGFFLIFDYFFVFFFTQSLFFYFPLCLHFEFVMDIFFLVCLCNFLYFLLSLFFFLSCCFN